MQVIEAPSRCPERVRLHTPAYEAFADHYDGTIGSSFFNLLRHTFDQLSRRLDLAFDSAADVGCGTGLFAKYLNETRRIPVYAVDSSPAMLRRAARRCFGHSILLLQQDMRQLRLPRQVDLVTANFDTLNYLPKHSDVAAFFSSANGNLRQGGYFVFDFVTPCGQSSTKRIYRNGAKGCATTVTQTINWNADGNRFDSILRISRTRKGLPLVEVHRQRAYWPANVAKLLSNAGFVVLDVVDPLTLLTASKCLPRLIVIAQKR